jgi:predicted component of type VI protein secretion system
VSIIGDDDQTRQSTMPTPTPDEQETAAHSDVGTIAELRAAFGTGEKKTLPLYSLPDSIVVGRGTASDWQLDDPSLSRKHCQFRWNGQQLTVEDLGSANGTRVSGRMARQPLPVGPDDVVSLGTVMISFAPLRLAQPGGRNPDAEATKLVSAPAGGAAETTPGPLVAGPTKLTATPARGSPPLSPVVTVVKAGQAGPPNARAAVFHPERDAAGPDEQTRLWDPSAALSHAAERNFDPAEIVARLKAAWRTNRRPFVLGFAALWVALLISLIALKQPRDSGEEVVPAPARAAAPAASGEAPKPAEAPKPVVTPLAPGEVPSPPSGKSAAAAAAAGQPVAGEPVAAERASQPGGAAGVELSGDPQQDLADAVAAYDNGRPQEALRYFKKLVAADPNDKAARFMVELIQARGGATP